MSEWTAKIAFGFVSDAPQRIRDTVGIAKKQFGPADYIFRVQANVDLQSPDMLEDDVTWGGLSWASSRAATDALAWVGTFAALLDDPKNNIATILFAAIPTLSPDQPRSGSPMVMKLDSVLQGLAKFCQIIAEEAPARRGGVHSCEWVLLECHRGEPDPVGT